jgi:hypothetical protein
MRFMLRRMLSAFVFGLLLYPFTACSDCTEASCPRPLRIEVYRSDTLVLAKGTYDVSILADNELLTFTCSIGASEDPDYCVQLNDTISSEIGASIALIPQPGSTELQGNFVGFWVEIGYQRDKDTIGPRDVDVSVSLDKSLILQRVLAPKYAEEEINGKGCGRCEIAETQTWLF